jgi:hypothetical protein
VGVMDRMTSALLWCSGFLMALALVLIVWGNDGGSTTEVGLLNGTPVHATAKTCDTMYHAEWVARGTPAHAGIVSSIKATDCPW